MSQDLKENEERLLSEQKKNTDLLKKQEQRYEKMKNHALTQLEM
jgi:transforming acidic coiled-coil-containing protein 3